MSNGPRVTFGIFDWHIFKKGILSYQTPLKQLEINLPNFWNLDPISGYSAPRKISFESSNSTKLFFFPNFSTAILKSNIISKKRARDFCFYFKILRKIFFVFSELCKKKKQSYFIWLVWTNESLLWKSRARFCAKF